LKIIENDKEMHVTRKRHGCVTAWLSFMIIINAFVGILYLFGSEKMAVELTGNINNGDLFIVLGITSTVNLILAVLMLMWKKWAFYGFIFTAIVALIINVSIGLGVGSILGGLIGVFVLYGILQIKGDGRSTWEQMI
jgi:hypothetical protein